MESRVAKLEALVEHIQSDITEVKGDMRELRKDIGSIRTTDFRLLFGATIVSTLGLAGLMAHGFKWI